MNLSWHLDAAVLATRCTAAEHFADVASETSGHGTRRGCCYGVVYGGHELEVEIVFGIHSAIANHGSERRNDSVQIVRAQSGSAHVQIGGEFFNKQVAARFDSRQRADARQFLAQVKARELSIEQADIAIGD